MKTITGRVNRREVKRQVEEKKEEEFIYRTTGIYSSVVGLAEIQK